MSTCHKEIMHFDVRETINTNLSNLDELRNHTIKFY